MNVSRLFGGAPHLIRRRPDAIAYLLGGRANPDLSGEVRFYSTPVGVVVFAEAKGLPRGESRFFGFHIHEGGECGGTPEFSNTGGHYDTDGSPHPRHKGDMPPLLSAGGRALSVFLTDAFSVDEILERAVIIHSHPDDFTTQPSGGAGSRIACGKIVRA